MKFLGRKTVKAEKTSAPKASKAPKATTATSTAAGKTASKRAPTHEQIAARSYELYLARGSQPGHEQEDWLQAERELGSGV